jgi:hypothetical protein
VNDSRLADEATILRSNLLQAAFAAKLVSHILHMYINISTKQGMQLASQKKLVEEFNSLLFASKSEADIMNKLNEPAI